MSVFHKARAGTRGGKDQFSWNTVKSDKDRECFLGHSVMAPTGRWQEGKDLTWYAKDRENEQQQIKSAEFIAAKKHEEDALMAALGMKPMPPPENRILVSKNSRTLKSKKDKKERKRKHSSESSSASESEEEVKSEPKHKHKKKRSHKEESTRHRTRSPSPPPPSSSSSKKDRSKHHRHH
ncbi:unnamed protein product [Adineta steineri]|uniref:Multiple myeloma tumor-associated protein 2-like N-terminal domain-containing protein n=1 Tax=Adineta steineri TaxID=433720 RepID=A0A813SRG0_9BILA|nr:unnamed protein product [Adineta steineri]